MATGRTPAVVSRSMRKLGGDLNAWRRAFIQVVVDRGVVTKFALRPAGTKVPGKK
jgi:hypothetical protein